MSCKALVVCVGVLILLIISSILPIFILYGDGLEATTAKRDNLLIAVLVPLLMTSFGSYIIFKLCANEDYKYSTCTFIVVLAVSVPVGWIFGLSFAMIPDSCATLEECTSYCAGKREVYQANLKDSQNVKLVILHGKKIECGTCTCAYPNHTGDHTNSSESTTFDLDNIISTTTPSNTNHSRKADDVGKGFATTEGVNLPKSNGTIPWTSAIVPSVLLYIYYVILQRMYILD